MRGILVALLFSVGLICCALLVRPVLPIDETRYLSVAWEMNWRGDYLVSYLSGQLYSHKPPLLFWLINLVWGALGQVNWAARLVAPAAGLGCLIMVFDVARKFWPSCSITAKLAPIILCSTLLWMVYLPLTMFDTLVALSMLVALRGMQMALSNPLVGWLVCGLGIGLGMLAKGPVILLFVISGMICLGFSQASQNSAEIRTQFAIRWLLGSTVAVVLGAMVILGWAIPSAMAASQISGGSGYAADLFVGQSTGRIVKSFAHQRPAYWYLPLLPICLMPWVAYPPVWRIIRVTRSDRELKMLLIWAGIVFSLFSLISGKQLHYILPLAPLLALAIARTIAVSGGELTRLDLLPIASGSALTAILPWMFDHWEVMIRQGLAGLIDPWSGPIFVLLGLAAYWMPVRSRPHQVVVISGTAVLWICCLLMATGPYWQAYNMEPMAISINQYQQPTAWFGDYQAQLNFLGRAAKIAKLEDASQLQRWLEEHDSSIVIFPSSKRRRQAAIEAKYSREMLDPTVSELERARWESHVQSHLSGLRDFRVEILAVQQLNDGLGIQDYFVVRLSKLF